MKYTDCVFSENSALFYGGPIGMILSTTDIIFQDRENVLPIEINSWWVKVFQSNRLFFLNYILKHSFSKYVSVLVIVLLNPINEKTAFFYSLIHTS